jgi:superfamily I DNA/RNA helicase
VAYTVVATAKIRQLEPKIVDALYENVDGKFYIDNEDALLGPVIALGDAPPPREYQSATVFGLGDIIEDADQAQRVAMHLDFKKSVLIDGPPGSGKTSIGIMRIPCLKFQQWDAMGLDRRKDPPFHTDSSMRVLVFSDEMKEYLSTLVKDLRVGVEVQTTHKFLLKLARDAKVLTGRPVRERPSIASLKSQKEVLAAYWAGFQSHTGKVWEEQKEELRQALPKAPVSLAESLSRWLMQQRRALPEAERVPPMPGPNMSREAARAALSQREAVMRDNEAAKEAKLKFDSNVKIARDLLVRLAAQLSDRAAIYGAMFDSSRFKDVLDAAAGRGLTAKQIQTGLKRWKEQQTNGCVTASEYDAALCAWLGVYVFSVADDNAQLLVGGRRTRLTHLVVDEVQDLSPCHIPVLASTLVRDGTLTLVGDVRQNLNQYGGLRSWREVLDHVADHKTFGTNYRQTQELGTFVRQLHGALFSETPQWQPSDRLRGPIPTAIEIGGAGKMAPAVADEIRRIRESLPGATVGLLYDGNLDPSRMRKFARRIGDLLADTSTEVHLATKSAAGARLRETDCVIIASVKETKGLEFDAVVFMSANYTLTKPVSEIPLKRRNGLYVATSRARHSLAIVMRKLPEYLGPLDIGGVVEIRRLEQDL